MRPPPRRAAPPSARAAPGQTLGEVAGLRQAFRRSRYRGPGRARRRALHFQRGRGPRRARTRPRRAPPPLPRVAGDEHDVVPAEGVLDADLRAHQPRPHDGHPHGRSIVGRVGRQGRDRHEHSWGIGAADGAAARGKKVSRWPSSARRADLLASVAAELDGRALVVPADLAEPDAPGGDRRSCPDRGGSARRDRQQCCELQAAPVRGRAREAEFDDHVAVNVHALTSSCRRRCPRFVAPRRRSWSTSPRSRLSCTGLARRSTASRRPRSSTSP